MFRTGQMLTASALPRNFSKVSKYICRHPQALLITQKSGEHLVLVNAEIFEDLLSAKFGPSQEEGDIRTVLEYDS
jgi:hypothetical protein